MRASTVTTCAIRDAAGCPIGCWLCWPSTLEQGALGDASRPRAWETPAWEGVDDMASENLSNPNTESTPFLALSQQSAGVTGGLGLVSDMCCMTLGRSLNLIFLLCDPGMQIYKWSENVGLLCSVCKILEGQLVNPVTSYTGICPSTWFTCQESGWVSV